MAQFNVVNAKGEVVGTVESDLGVKLSAADKARPGSGGKRYITCRVTLGDFSASTSIWQTGTKAAKPEAKIVETLKL